ncbi:MFS transporter [Mycobacterium sp. 050134]|uniref:MFS transporter n=1 Tax=Mycobacterium sp. 050134 TaxID=3096111 RepID=UPI002ED7D7D2
MSSTSSAGSYRAVHAIPNAAPTFGAALLGRLAFGLLPLAMLFTVEHATHSFASAGGVLACYGLTTVLLPLKARIIDRYGQATVLPALTVGSAAALGAMAALDGAGLHAPGLFVLLAIVCGLCAPPLGPAMRAVWRTLTDDTNLVTRAYSLDSVCEEVIYLIGPLLVGVMITTVSASGALIVAAALLLAGTFAMSAMPAVRRTKGTVSGEPVRFDIGPLRSAGFCLVVLTILITAIGMSVAITCVAARAQNHGMPAAAGYIEAALAVGSVLGGLAWGRRRHARAVSTHLTGLTVTLAVGTAIAAGADNLIVLGVVMALSGVAVAPLFVASYLASDQMAPAHHRTEASTWVNTANNIGAAAGTAAAGILVDRVDTTFGFAAGAVLLALSAAVVRAGRQSIDHHDQNHTLTEDAVPQP